MGSIGLEKYIKPLLETKDFTAFGQGDEEALEPWQSGSSNQRHGILKY